MYHQVLLTMRSCVLYVSQNKHQILPYTTLTEGWSFFWRYALSPSINQIHFLLKCLSDCATSYTGSFKIKKQHYVSSVTSLWMLSDWAILLLRSFEMDLLSPHITGY